MSAPTPRGTAALVRLRLSGVAFLVVIALLVALTVALYQKAFTPVVNVTLQADRIGNQLAPPADVKVRGLIVGTVREVSSTGDGAKVRLALQPDKVKLIPKDVRARLLPKTLFGEKFVALVLPDDGAVTEPIAEGDVIPQDRSETAIETEKVLDDLLPLLQTLKPEQLSMTLNAVADAVRGRGKRIGENLVAVDAYFQRLNPEMPGIQENIRRLAQLSEDYGAAAPDFLATLDNFSAIGRNLVDQQDELGTFLASTTTSVDVLDDVLKENEKRFVTLARDSLPSLLLYERYSPEFPCVAKGLNQYQPIVEDTFGVRQPGLHITLEVTEDQDGYVPGDEQENRDTRGPYCDGLPKPTPPAPDAEFKDGYRDAERAGIGSTRARSGDSARAASLDPARSLADPFSQRQILKAAAAPVLGVPVDEVPDLVEMLFGPVARGTTVGLA
jgi:virulence factor Mce-like protein